MLRCAILDDYQNTALSRADFSVFEGRVAFDVFNHHIADTPDLVATLQPYDIVVAMRERAPMTRERLSQLPRLKLLITTGMRNASIDGVAAKELGITYCGTTGFAGSTAELTWGLLLSIMRQIPQELEHFRAASPQWQRTVGRDLRGLNLGVIGLGTLGSKVCSFGLAFGMNVSGWSLNNTAVRSAAMGIGFAPALDGLLAQSDVVSIHIPLNGATRGLLGARELGLMRQGAVLLNTSRGPIVDEAALIAALKSGHLSA
ncbi:MAG: D-2-hydroxyacid dehydrogenase family protein, partial [Rhizobiales bacterium]|nr:D-2-hydroxyacid dehydrogenase family protein [Hyphomicrobiales bacterium]